VRDWISGFRSWRALRKRFAEEWDFHRDMAALDLQWLGLTPREARRNARSRLGDRAAHRQEALREIGGDARGLIAMLPIPETRRSPWLIPVMLGLFIGLALGLNPFRTQVIESMRRFLPFTDGAIVSRLVPLTPPGAAPTGIARLTLWTFLLLGCVRLAGFRSHRSHWRAAVYGTGMLFGLGLVWCICWVTSVGILLHARWGCDLVQGAALIVLLFGYSMLGYGVLRWWWHDLKSRCPCCLRLLGMTQHRGKAQDVLLEPLEIESVCLYGHGQAKESRWRREFECDTSTYF